MNAGARAQLRRSLPPPTGASPSPTARLRMLVLLHFYQLGYSPFALAFLFLLYEAAGIAANLVGGWLATRYGIARMLAVGLVDADHRLSAAVRALAGLGRGRRRLAWVVVAQRAVSPRTSPTGRRVGHQAHRGRARPGQLFKWVAWSHGSKNAMKGMGFFLGGVLLQVLGFQRAGRWPRVLAFVLAGVAAFMPPADGKEPRPSRSAQGAVRQEPTVINLLAAARVVLFGARDVWFVVGVPVFFVCEGLDLHHGGRLRWRCGPSATARCRRWRRGSPGAVPTAALAPRCPPPGAGRSALAAVAIRHGLAVLVALQPAAPRVGGGGRASAVFGLAFAVNSSVHSYLVLAYAGSEKAAGSRLLLRRQRGGALHGHAAVGPAVPVGRLAVRAGRVGLHVAGVLAVYFGLADGAACTEDRSMNEADVVKMRWQPWPSSRACKFSGRWWLPVRAA